MPLNASGTNTSSTEYESDAVPRSPMVFQVSCKTAWSAGNNRVRIAGRPSWFCRRDPSASTTWQCTPIHVACRQPLEKSHRPLTRYPPGTARASHEFGGPQDTRARGSAKIARADSSGLNGAISAEELPTNTFHATEASARAISATTAMNSQGGTSSPSTERGSNSRNSRLACMLSSSSAGMRRVRSIVSDACAIAGTSARAREIGSAAEIWSMGKASLGTGRPD